MHRKCFISFFIAVLTIGIYSSALAQSDWWIKGSRKGDEKNIAQNVNIGDVIVFGQYKNKSMEWKVLDKNQGNVLLISTQSIFSESYNTVRSKFTTWENCTLRKKLNDFYLSNTFSQTQRDRIQRTFVDNSTEQHRNMYGKIGSQPDTDDYVFLLSWQEANQYFPTDADRKRGRGWWTRSPGEFSGAALAVGSDGIMTYGNGASSNMEDIYPVLWLNLD